ncbi:hypothetical protein TRVA0_004S03378 [Trichomonascus vanleenenianus]|uniref:uncharacterized protein n=1 Tax=Trichomonascus vanleenenianus TaxID=2268995 RepID=UPI003ECA9DFA
MTIVNSREYLFIPVQDLSYFFHVYLALLDSTTYSVVPTPVKLSNFAAFKSAYAPIHSLIPDAQTYVWGQTISITSESLEKIDAHLEEGRTFSRLPIHLPINNLIMAGNAYFWNGNSVIGEYEYSPTKPPQPLVPQVEKVYDNERPLSTSPISDQDELSV